jgi:hypothetical protein
MPRIIPQELNKKLRSEYRLRFFYTLFFALSLAILISISLVFSSYFLLSLYEKAYTNNDMSGKGLEVTKLNDIFNAKVVQIDALAQKIPLKDKGTNIKITDTLLDYAGASINISGLQIVSDAQSSQITLQGTALTRDTLLQFQQKIQNDDLFRDFSIPIDVLTKQRDLSFNVNFTYHEN